MSPRTAIAAPSRRLARGTRLVIATHNPGKLREIADLLAPYGVECLAAGALGLPEPEETGDSFIANATIKAEAAAAAADLPALADDSGFSVAALDGQPGIHAALWAGPGRDFTVAMERVQGLLGGPQVTSPAWFTCALVLAWPDGITRAFEGEIHGHTVWPPRGAGGFGYDAMFLPDGQTQTFGEMEPAQKHAISHRARAFAQLVAACF